MVFFKRAQTGIGTLIIFIAMILVAAIAAGVLIQTSNSLQSKALETGSQARSQVTTHVDVVSISAADGTYGAAVNFFTEVFKLASGSDPIRTDQLLITLDTVSFTSTLTQNFNQTDMEDYFTYGKSVRAASNVISNETYVYLRNDLDDDGVQERIRVNQQCTGLDFDLRNGTVYNITFSGINLSACSSSSANCTFGHTFTNASLGITGTLTLSGTSQSDCAIDSNVNLRSSTDNSSKVGTGYYTLNYYQKSPQWQTGYVQRGDVVEVRYAATEDVYEDTKIRTSILPKSGIPTPTQMVTPEVITQQRIYLYP